MGTLKIKGQTSGSVSLKAPDTGSDAILTLPGTTGELLPLAGGKILQIVRATDTTQRSTTSTTFVDASISVTITPQKNDSAILLIWAFSSEHVDPAGVNRFTITDASNNIVSGLDSIAGSSSTSSHGASNTLIAYATPETTSPTTYKGRFRTGAGTGVIQNAQNTGQLFAVEVSA